MQTVDWIVISIYFGLIGFVAWWYGRQQKDTTDYFLAGRNAGWITIGASIFTSNIGSEHIVGLAGQGAATGMAMAHWELHAWVLIMLAGLFVPFYYKSGVETIPSSLKNASARRTRLDPLWSRWSPTSSPRSASRFMPVPSSSRPCCRKST
jgi:solute:Na+ symporter, SSS family